MNSSTAPDFWEWFQRLSPERQRRARRAYRLWRLDPRHPSLRFKRVGRYWSIRVDDGYRALAVEHEGVFVWFYIGPHDRYERQI